MMDENAILALSTATAAGERARAARAKELAGSFRRGPKTFDPRNLERLGPAGLQQFLSALDHQGARNERPIAPTDQGTPRIASGERMGWPHLRRSETSPWCADVGVAVAVGSSIVVAGAAVLSLAQLVAKFGEIWS